MKEAATGGQQTSEFAMSRRSRRATERTELDTEATTLDSESNTSDTQPMMFDSEHLEQEPTSSETEPIMADTEQTEPENEGSDAHDAQKRLGFRHWRHQRPFIGGVLVVLGGIELFFSGQLDAGQLHIQFGIEGLQATVIPIAIVLLGLFATFRPTHHMFYGIIALVLGVYSLIGVNLGGFILGMLLSSIGAVLVVAWMGPKEPKSDAEKSGSEAPGTERRGDEESAGEERNL